MHAGSRALLARALREGTIDRVGQGRYVLRDLDESRRAAAQLGGALSHASAVAAHGWEMLHAPRHVDVVVPRGRRAPKDPATSPRNVRIHHRAVAASELERGVTGPLRTVLDCARTLPFGQALAIADSAARCHAIELEDLHDAAATARGPGARAVRRVAQEASPLAANCFESAVRAIALDVPGLGVQPQVAIDLEQGRVFVDLADELLRIVIEADSFEFHGTPAALSRDARRYNWLTAHGWRVLRVTWDAAIDDPALVATWMASLVARSTHAAA